MLTEPHPDTTHIKELAQNESFKRFTNNLKLYQDLFAEAADKELVRARMKKIFLKKTLDREPTAEDILNASFDTLVLAALDQCEEGQFSADNFLTQIEQAQLTAPLLRKWSPKAGDTVAGGAIMLNDLIAYHLDEETKASIHIIASNISGADIYTKLFDGIIRMSEALKTELTSIKTINLKSWLLASDFQDKIKAIFGDKIQLETVESKSDETEIEVGRRVPLRFNAPSLKRYLTTGEEPEIRELNLTREEFFELANKLQG